MLFDKTGTLTKGEPARHRRRRRRRTPATPSCWRLAAAVEADSEHPLARAIVAAADDSGRRARPSSATDFRSLTGRGVRARRRRHAKWPSAARRCCARPATDGARRARRSHRGLGRGAAPRCCTSCATARCSARSRSRTRSAPSPGRRSTRCTPVGIEVAMITGDARQVADAVGRGARHRRGVRRGAARGQGRRGRRTAGRAGDGSRWSATASTTPPRWRAPTSASPSAPAPTWPSSPPGWCWPPTTRAAVLVGHRALPTPATARCVQNLAWAAGYNVHRRPARRRGAGLRRLRALAGGRRDPDGVSTIVVALNAQLLRRLDLDPVHLARTGTPVSHHL